MAERTLSRADRREPLGVGHDVDAHPASGRIIAVAHDDDGRVQVLVDHGEHRTRISWSALAKARLDRRPAPPSDALNEYAAPLLAELPEGKRDVIVKRYRDLLQVQYGSPRGDAEGDRRAGILHPDYDPLTTTVTQRVETKSRELRALGDRGVSRATLYRQLERLDEGPDFLIHGNHRTVSQRLNEFDPALLDIVRAAVSAEQDRTHKSQRKLLARIRSQLDQAAVGQDVTRHQLGVLVGEVSRGLGLHHSAKTRRTEASRPVVVYGTQRVSRPGELVQVDATPTTVAILGPHGVLVPAVILSAIDIYTRFFVALRVCVNAVTLRDVCALIAQMGRPTVTRAGHPYELEYWHGIPKLVAINDDPEGEKTTVQKVIGRKPRIHPSTIVFDHGSENASDHVMRYAAECGIDVVFCPPRKGHTKGVVEASHRVLAGVESAMPIHKGQNVLNRPLELELAVPIKPQDLQDMLWEYVIDIYANEEHRTLTDAHGSHTPLSPAMVWADYVTSYGEVDTPADPWAFLKGLERTQRQLGPEGIRLNKVTYNSSGLQDLRSVVMSGIGTKARPLTVFFDRFDTTRVFLVHPVQRHWMVVPRASARNGSIAPMSGLVHKLALEGVDCDVRRTLTDEQRHRLEAAMLTRWSQGVFANRQEARFAAIEESRQRTHAHDLEEASEEVRLLAFPQPDDAYEPEFHVYTEERNDDEEIEYDEEITFDDDQDGNENDADSGWGLA